MIEAIRGWITTICAGMFFIIAVEMILPNNGIKKYAKFALGLIMMMIIINPVIKFMDKGFDANVYANKAEKMLDLKDNKEKYEYYKEKNMANTKSVFKTNLEQACEKKLKEKYPENFYKVAAEVKYVAESESFIIERLNVSMNNSAIDQVKKVEIHTNSNMPDSNTKTESAEQSKIKTYLSEELKIARERIYFSKF